MCVCAHLWEVGNSSCLVTPCPVLCKWDRPGLMAALSSLVMCGLSLVLLAMLDAKKIACLSYSGERIVSGLSGWNLDYFSSCRIWASLSHMLLSFPSLSCVICVSLCSVLQRVKKHNETSCLEPWPLFPFLLESFQCYLYETSGPTIKKPSRPG